jgi:biopolymer transport protein ExbB/TolQ
MRLGLIGTVIGFVLMLSSVYGLKQGDVNALQQLLATMGSGMQVALYTTLTGLGTALLIGIQCQWLDHCADNLISQIIKLVFKSGYARNQPDTDTQKKPEST